MIKKNFFAGLALLLPLLLSFFIGMIVINMLTNPFMGIMTSFLSYYHFTFPDFYFMTSETALKLTCQALILSIFVTLVFTIGIGMRVYLFNQFVVFWDKVFHRIPFIGKIYQACRDVIRTLFDPAKHDFGYVVLIPFPHKNLLSIGLITNDVIVDENHEESDDLISVFVPAVPNPLMGFLLLYRRKDIIFTDMRVEKAIKAIISCGLMTPNFNTIKLSS